MQFVIHENFELYPYATLDRRCTVRYVVIFARAVQIVHCIADAETRSNFVAESFERSS